MQSVGQSKTVFRENFSCIGFYLRTEIIRHKDEQLNTARSRQG